MRKIFLTALLASAFSFSQLMARPDITWSSPPVTLSTLGVNASSPQAVIDLNGNATAAWIESGDVKSASHPVGGSWGSTSTLSSSGLASTPCLSVDSSGNVTAIWIDNGIINTATLPFGGSWSAAAAISSSGASGPALAVDGTGNAVAIWARNGFIESATKLFGGSWSLVHMLSSGGSEDGPQVAIGANGTVVAVWHTSVSGDNIFYSTSLISGSWNTAKSIFSIAPGFQHNFPRVAVDANGNATVVWYRYTFINPIFDNTTVYTSSLSANAAGWSIPVQLSTPGQIRNSSDLVARIGYDINGNAIALWVNSPDGATFSLESAVKQLNGSWSVANQVFIQNLYGFEADLSVMSVGDCVSSFMFFDGSSVLIQSAETDVASSSANFWSVPQNISQGSNNGFPRVAAALMGTTINAVSVWINSNGVNNTIVAVTGSKAVLAPPTSPTVTQSSTSFGIFTEYFNTVSWTASTAPNILSYSIFRNGVFFTSVDPSTLQIVDHNVVSGGAVTYGIATVNLEGDQSPLATVSFP